MDNFVHLPPHHLCTAAETRGFAGSAENVPAKVLRVMEISGLANTLSIIDG